MTNNAGEYKNVAVIEILKFSVMNHTWPRDAIWRSSNKLSIDVSSGFSPVRHQAISWTNTDLLSTRNKSHWNLNQNTTLFIQDHVFDNVVYKISVIFFSINVLMFWMAMSGYWVLQNCSVFTLAIRGRFGGYCRAQRRLPSVCPPARPRNHFIWWILFIFSTLPLIGACALLIMKFLWPFSKILWHCETVWIRTDWCLGSPSLALYSPQNSKDLVHIW